MPPPSISRTVSADAPPSQHPRSPSNNGRAVTRVKQEDRDDADSPAAQPSSPGASAPFFSAPTSPATQTPAFESNHDHSIPMSLAPVNQHFLAEYYRIGAYSDLDVVSAGVVRSVHRIVICSESPVLEAMCSNLKRRDQRLDLNQYDPGTLDRVLDFCYHRTYSDTEYPETVAPFLTRMTAAAVRDALESPLAVASDVVDPGWWAESVTWDDYEGPEEEQDYEEQQDPEEGHQGPAEDQDSDEEQDPDVEQDSDEDMDEYVPYSCDIHCPLAFDSDSSNDEVSSVDIPTRPQSPMNLPQPPYAISLFANFRVYVAAKELQIPALLLVARNRFVHSFQAHWARFADLPGLIEQVYSWTDEGDPLRALICQIVAAGYDSKFEMDFRTEIRELMVKNGEFSAEVLDATLRLRRGWTDTWE